MEVILTDSAPEEGLLRVGQLHLVGPQKVVRDRQHLTVVRELASEWVLVEDNLVNNVPTLVSPLGDDALTLELITTPLHGHGTVLVSRENLLDTREARLSRHELEDRVDHQSAANLSLID